jgi:hypothetical protein
MTTSTDYKIGLTLVGLTWPSGVPLPAASPVSYAAIADLGNAKTRGLGYLMCEWRWAYLASANVSALRVYCPEPQQSGDIYIKTLKTAGGMGVYAGVIIWPQVEPAGDDDCYNDFVIQFRALVEQTST